MRENVVISYRGASFEIGRAPGIYGIWPVADPASGPLEWWPQTAEGWYSAWSRFSSLEVPGTIAAAAESHAPSSGVPPQAVAGVALLVIGVVSGVVGLFAIYLAAWAVSAVLISLGGARLRAGAMLGVGTSLVTFGFFLSDAGTPIAGGAHLMGAGLVLGLFGWLTCAVGSAAAFAIARPAGARDGQRRSETVRLLPLSLCALGVAAAFAPAWDSYVLTSPGGTTQSFTAGNVFSNPAPVIAGNVAVMIAFVAVVLVAVFWRRVPAAGALVAGALVPMVAQAVSALVQLGEAATPAMFGISAAAAARAGLRITSGVTWAFWVYCACSVALVLFAASTFGAPRRLARRADPAGSPMSATARGA
ncbi:MAG: hypothetical protein ABSE47_18060 [Acidimicrobiales bacterium]